MLPLRSCVSVPSFYDTQLNSHTVTRELSKETEETASLISQQDAELASLLAPGASAVHRGLPGTLRHYPLLSLPLGTLSILR